MRTILINKEVRSVKIRQNRFRVLPRNLWLLPLLAVLVSMTSVNAQTPVIYLGATPGAPVTCNCLNNATTLTNGQFSEQITIEAPAGQTWTISGVSGLFSASSPAPPAAPVPIAAGTPIAETAAGSGIYRISVRHVDGVGFTLTAGNGLQTLSISNTCYYPNPQITGLSSQYCTSSLPVTLTGNAGGAAGTGSFTVNGLPATVFNPLQSGPGTYTIRYTFDAGTGAPGNAGDPGCSAFVEQVVTVLETPNIATNDLVNVTLNANCSALITPDMILEGEYPCIDQDYVVTVFDQAGNAIGNTVTSAHAGQTLPVRVSTLAGGFSGIGNIYITDPLSPTVTCPPNTNTAVITQQIQFLQGDLNTSSSTFVPLNFNCFSSQVNPAIGQHYYRLDTFTVTQNDLYIFELDAAYGRGLGAIYEGVPAFFNGPCLSLLSASNLVLPGVGYFSDSTDIVRIAIQLQAGQVYSIMTSTFSTGQTGTFRWAVYSAGNGRLSGRPVTNGTIRSKLFCTDAASLTNIAGSIQFTGAPVAQDNCTAQPVVTFTDQVTSNGICGNTLINRLFTVRDGANNSVQCTQTITVGKASSPDIVYPAKSVLVSCNANLQTTPEGNPSPIATGRPLVYSAFGVHYLDSPFCNLIASFADQPRTSTCAGNYQFIRRWYIFDDCNPAATASYDQVIRVVDTTPPVITISADTTYYSTLGGSCTASFEVPLPAAVTDNCSNVINVLTEVLTEVPVQLINEVGQVTGTIMQTQVLATFPQGIANRNVANIPVGCHRIRYTATDGCGNATTKIMTFCVRDQALPTAVCDDQLIMSLGGSVGTLLVTDVDEGSNDACGLASIEVRRMLTKDPVTCQPVTPYYTTWGPSVQFYCCDAGSTMHTELRATDLQGNRSVCITQVTIEDNTRPTCVPPNNMTVLCSNLPANFNPNNLTQLNTLFGAAQAQDNCNGATVEELSPVVSLNLCGSGTITRRFQARDVFGNTSAGICQQQVTIQPSNIYNLKFPKDLTVNCTAPAPDTAQMIALGCDRFSISVQDLQISAPGEACYKIFRTYHLINHCEYNGNAPAIEISRDEDCDGVPGDEDVWVLRRTNGIFTDRDNDPANAIPAAGTRGTSCPGGNNPAGYWREVVASNGYWTYTQVIKVQNNVPPVISVIPGSTSFCSFDNNTCLGEAIANFSVQQSCQTGPVTVKVFIDLGRNGSLDQEVTATALFGAYPNYNIRGNYSVGLHAFVVRVEDACGNQAQSNLPFQVIDCVAAAPICLTNLSIVLQALPPGVDIDGDGDNDSGFAVLPALNFVGSPVTENCSGPIRYSIHRSQDVLNGTDVPNPGHDSLLLTCDDEGIILVRLYAWDNAYNPLLQQPNGTIGGPNFTFCEAFLTVQDNQPQVCGFLPTLTFASIAGLVISESGEPVEGVSLRPAEAMPVMDTTGVDGAYELDNLETGHEYTIQPHRPGDWMNGVSTIDLVLISRHILGTQLLNSPYKLIAADANGSGSVTTLDVVLLRKLILGISTELSGVPSWRFVDANYAFPNALNPWQEPFPQVISLSNLNANMGNEDFIAVKTGDINGSAQFNFQQAENRTVGAPFVLQASGKNLAPGDICHLTLKAPGIEGLEGLQGTLQFDTDALELIGIENGILQEEHLGSKALLDGLLTFSWNWPREADVPENEVLLTLVFRANDHVDMSQAVALNSGITKAEAYNEADLAMPLSLVFLPDAAPDDRIELYQNRPNPFRDETTIGFNLPAASQVRLVVSDLSGKTVWELNGYYDAGKHEVEFQAERQLATGVLLYRIEALGHTATGKMVRID